MAICRTHMNTDIKNIYGFIKTVSAAPTHVPKKIEEQVKILGAPATSVTGQATVGLVDEVYLRDLPFLGGYITDASWPYNVTGQAITSSSTVSMPPPLVSGTTYYIIRISEHICKLAATYADALAGTPIHITSSESGIWTIVASGAPVSGLQIFDTISNTWKSVPFN